MGEIERRPTRIGFDARYLSHGLIGGVHTYVRNLLLASVRLPERREWHLYIDDKAPFDLAGLPNSCILHTLPWRNGLSSVANDLRLGTRMRRDGITVAHNPANYGFAQAGLPLVITLHDAINLLPLRQILRDDSKTPRHVALMAYLHLMTTAAVRRQPDVITVSHYSRREILRHSTLTPDRVHVVHSAHEPIFRPLAAAETRDLRERLRLRQRVLLADATKNPACTLRAYRALPRETREQTSLVLFSRRPPARFVEAAAADGECLLLLRPPRDELIALYNLANFFIFPSWYEGFGIPALEAMACGTPPIASDRGSLPEVVGGGGIVVDAEDHEAIAATVRDLFAQPAAYDRLREAALARAQQFSWERAAQQTMAVYDVATHRHTRATRGRYGAARPLA